MDIPAQKQALRRVMVERILAIDPDDRRRQDADLIRRLATLPGFDAAGTVLLYVSAFPEEIATGPALRQVLSLGKRLVCPRVDRPARRLRLFRVDDLQSDLVSGSMGIPEPGRHLAAVAPEEIDWALVPGLAFDDRGFRLGRGGGYYDRLLPTLRPDAPRWALAYDCQRVASLPNEPHDQPLDGIVSPERS
jgi:5-formyltetrahydrofolate cyclo-ligase